MKHFVTMISFECKNFSTYESDEKFINTYSQMQYYIDVGFFNLTSDYFIVLITRIF